MHYGQKVSLKHNYMWPLSTKSVISITDIFVAIAIVWVYNTFMPKMIRILSKDHVPWRYFVNIYMFY